MNKRKNDLVISLCKQLCEVLDRSLIVFWANRPKLWSCFSEEEQKYLANTKKTEQEQQQEEVVLCNEFQNVLNK